MSQALFNPLHFAVCREVGLAFNGLQGAYYRRDQVALPPVRYLSIVLKEADQQERQRRAEARQPQQAGSTP
jgi:hypothetical protein